MLNKGFNPGDLETKVYVQSYTTSVDDYGQVSKSWSNPDYIWAKIDILPSSESGNVKSTHEKEFAEMYIRYNSSYKAYDRVSINSEFWRIVSKQVVGRNQFIKFKLERFDRTENVDG